MTKNSPSIFLPGQANLNPPVFFLFGKVDESYQSQLAQRELALRHGCKKLRLITDGISLESWISSNHIRGNNDPIGRGGD